MSFLYVCSGIEILYPFSKKAKMNSARETYQVVCQCWESKESNNRIVAKTSDGD